MVVTMAPGKHRVSRPVPISSQDGNEHLQHADTLRKGCFVFVLKHYTPEALFVNFIHSPADFFLHIDPKKVCTLIKVSKGANTPSQSFQ